MKTFSQHLADFLGQHEASGRSPHTIRMLRHCVGHTLRWLEETQQVTGPEQLNRQHLEQWSKTVRTRRTAQGLPLQPTSIAKEFDTTRTFIQWLEKNGALPLGLHQEVPRLKLPQLLPTSVLRHEEMEQLLKETDTTTVDGFQLRAMLEFLYTSGVRVAELLSLDLESVDLIGRTARVMGKGRKERIVPFGLTACEFLEAYLSGIRPLRLRDSGETAFWLDRKGQRMPYHTFRRNLIEVADATDLEQTVRPHTFRRSCTTVLIRGGANIWHVKELLGHERLETLDPYVRLEITDLRKTHANCHPREKDLKNETQ